MILRASVVTKMLHSRDDIGLTDFDKVEFSNFYIVLTKLQIFGTFQ